MSMLASKWSKAFWYDLGERVGATFLGALLAYITTDNVLDAASFEQLWPILGLPVAVSLIKGLLANVADGESGASLVPAPPGPVLVDDPAELPVDGVGDPHGEAGESAVSVALTVLVVVVIVILLVRFL